MNEKERGKEKGERKKRGERRERKEERREGFERRAIQVGASCASSFFLFHTNRRVNVKFSILSSF